MNHEPSPTRTQRIVGVEIARVVAKDAVPDILDGHTGKSIFESVSNLIQILQPSEDRDRSTGEVVMPFDPAGGHVQPKTTVETSIQLAAQSVTPRKVRKDGPQNIGCSIRTHARPIRTRNENVIVEHLHIDQVRGVRTG